MLRTGATFAAFPPDLTLSTPGRGTLESCDRHNGDILSTGLSTDMTSTGKSESRATIEEEVAIRPPELPAHLKSFDKLRGVLSFLIAQWFIIGIGTVIALASSFPNVVSGLHETTT